MLSSTSLGKQNEKVVARTVVVENGFLSQQQREYRFDELPLRYLRLRRVLEVALVVVVLPLLLPFCLLLCVAIRLESSGGVLYWQNRIGKDGKIFRMVKFRSMKYSDHDGTMLTEENDLRVTRIGKFIRRHRIDEIPQLWHVLVGEMSLIGPRPDPAAVAPLLEQNIPLYGCRRALLPGLTGWSQVCIGYTSDIEGARVKLDHDLYYLQHLSPWFDLRILLRTLRILYTGFGAR